MATQNKLIKDNILIKMAKYASLIILVIIIPLEILHQILLGTESGKLGLLYNGLFYIYFFALIFVTLGYIVIGRRNKLNLLIYIPSLFLLLKGTFVLPDFVLESLLDTFVYIIIITEIVFLLFCAILIRHSLLGKPLRKMGIIGVIRAILSVLTFSVMLLYEDLGIVYGWTMVILIFSSIALFAIFHYLQYVFFSRKCNSKMYA